LSAYEENLARKYQLAAAGCVLLILLGCVVGILVPAGLGWDFANFYDTGRRVAAGQIGDIYNSSSLIRGEPPQGEMGFWGTPVSAFLYVPLSWLAPSPALILFKIENSLACFAALSLLFVHGLKFVEATPTARWRFAALFAFLALIYQPFWTVFRVGGQTTPTVLLLLTLGLLAHEKQRFVWSALLFVIVILMKPAFATGLLFLVLVSNMRFAAFTGAYLASIGAVSVATMGWTLHAQFLGKMLGGLGLAKPWLFNSSLYILVSHFRELAGSSVPAVVFTAASLAIRAGVIGTFVWILLKSRSRSLSTEGTCHFAFLMAVSFFLLISQTLWEHYLAVMFLPLSYIIAARSTFGREAIAIVTAIFVFSLGQNLIFTEFLHDRFTFASLPAVFFVALLKSAPLWLMWAFLWRHHDELLDSYDGRGWT
jgi:hypothetical protein